MWGMASVTQATSSGDLVSARPWDFAVNEGNMACPLRELGIHHVSVQTYHQNLESMQVGTVVSEQDRSRWE